MPPPLALFLCLGFIYWLFRTDRKHIQASRTLLVPGLWFAFLSSRAPVLWFYPSVDVEAGLEGSPINLIVYFSLMVSSLLILSRRQFNWSSFILNNKGLIFLYLYFVVSFLWSDLPLLSLKRIAKDFGTVLAVLVVLTEPNPFLSLRIVFARVSFVLFPLSVCFIKYFPSWGRMMSKSWELMYTGVTTHKNSLGATTMVCLIMLIADVIELRKNDGAKSNKVPMRLRYLMLAMGGWLMLISDSKTSLVCTLVGLFILWLGRKLVRKEHPRRILLGYAALAGALAALQPFLGIEDMILHALNRNATLTGRDAVWKMIGQQHINPILGSGYEVFWDSQAAQDYRDEGGTAVVSTHNGYLEVYVDGGIIGVLLLAGMIVSGFSRILRQLPGGSSFVVTRLTFMIAVLCHNLSESSFFRLGPLWFTFLAILIYLPDRPAELSEDDNVVVEELPSEAEYTATVISERRALGTSGFLLKAGVRRL
jgi:O-antigen ligase